MHHPPPHFDRVTIFDVLVYVVLFVPFAPAGAAVMVVVVIVVVVVDVDDNDDGVHHYYYLDTTLLLPRPPPTMTFGIIMNLYRRHPRYITSLPHPSQWTFVDSRQWHVDVLPIILMTPPLVWQWKRWCNRLDDDDVAEISSWGGGGVLIAIVVAVLV